MTSKTPLIQQITDAGVDVVRVGLDGLRIAPMDDKLAVVFRYSEDAVAAMRTVPGAKFDRINRCWMVGARGVKQLAVAVPAILAGLSK